jgi:predicted metal-dependent hydrolase
MDDLLRKGVGFFNNGEFFACHEELEKAWTQAGEPERLFLQAIIHVAVAFHHCRCGNPEGASGQLRKALRKLVSYLPSYESLDTARLYADALAAATRIEAGQPVLEFPRIGLAAASQSAAERAGT